MTAAVARAVMALAVCCMGESRREWAEAMRAEFDEALAEGKPFAFAIGCLAAAWREMPEHAEGRLGLANYTLALGLVIPMAALQFALPFGFSTIVGEGFGGVLLIGADTRNPVLACQSDAAPCLLALWLMLGVGHLRLAWVLVARDWARMAKTGAFICATLITLYIVMALMVLDLTFVILQTLAIAVELRVLVAVARRHAELLADAAEMPLR
jgi:hypothetical protein